MGQTRSNTKQHEATRSNTHTNTHTHTHKLVPFPSSNSEVSDFVSRLIHTFSRVLNSPDEELHAPSLDLLCLLVVQLGASAMVFEPIMWRCLMRKADRADLGPGLSRYNRIALKLETGGFRQIPLPSAGDSKAKKVPTNTLATGTHAMNTVALPFVPTPTHTHSCSMTA